MRIDNNADRKDITPAVAWISGLIGGLVDKRVAGFIAQEQTNPMLTAHFEQTFGLEFALARARRYKRSTGRLPKGPEFDRLHGFLIPAHRIHRMLPEAIRLPFEGRLRDAVNGMHGARPFAYEIAIASHLMQKEWDIEFADYAGLGRFDLLARKGSIEVEVECKTTSDDTGRKAHRQEVNRLCDLALPALVTVAEEPGCHLVKAVVADRLEKSEARLAQIAGTIKTAILENGIISDDTLRVEYSHENLSTWPDPDREQNAARVFFEKRMGVDNSNLFFHVRRGHSIAVLSVTSAKPDSVVDSIAEEAKKAAKQCSGTRPALVALNLVDSINRPELETLLTTPNGLHTITHAVFKNETRLHVDSVVFTIPQTVQHENGVTRLSGQAIALNNPSPKFACEELKTIFR
jgi:hypothetical protein